MACDQQSVNNRLLIAFFILLGENKPHLLGVGVRIRFSVKNPFRYTREWLPTKSKSERDFYHVSSKRR